jgi:hypothetical protein
LEFLRESHPDGRWWLKADGTDIQQGLRESMRNEWSGDVDLGDGKLQDKYSRYAEYLKFVCSIGLKDRSSLDNIKEDLHKQTSTMITEKEFLVNGQADAQKEYQNLQRLANAPEKSLFASAWEAEEYKRLLEKNVTLTQTMKNVMNIIDSGNTQSINIGSILANLRKELLEYVKGIILN